MIKLISSFGLFTCGIIAACIDWNNLMNYFLRFDYPTQQLAKAVDGSDVVADQENQFNPKIIIGIFFVLIFLYFLIVYIPAKILFEHLEGKIIKYLN